MEPDCGWIVAFKLDQRADNAAKAQEVLTKHGCIIKVRLGLHETSQDYCAEHGLIVLQCCGTDDEIEALVSDLNAVEGVTAKSLQLEL